jgi:hypothetical protein
MPSYRPDQSLLQILECKIVSLTPEFVGSELHSLPFKARRSFIGRTLTQRGHPLTDFQSRQVFERRCFHIDVTGSYEGPFPFQLWCFEGAPQCEHSC